MSVSSVYFFFFFRLLIHGNVTFVQPGTICHGWNPTWSRSALQTASEPAAPAALRGSSARALKGSPLGPAGFSLRPAPPLLHRVLFTSAFPARSPGIPVIYHLPFLRGLVPFTTLGQGQCLNPRPLGGQEGACGNFGPWPWWA